MLIKNGGRGAWPGPRQKLKGPWPPWPALVQLLHWLQFRLVLTNNAGNYQIMLTWLMSIKCSVRVTFKCKTNDYCTCNDKQDLLRLPLGFIMYVRILMFEWKERNGYFLRPLQTDGNSFSVGTFDKQWHMMTLAASWPNPHHCTICFFFVANVRQGQTDDLKPQHLQHDYCLVQGHKTASCDPPHRKFLPVVIYIHVAVSPLGSYKQLFEWCRISESTSLHFTIISNPPLLSVIQEDWQ